MKLIRLEINGYKNLKGKTVFDFSNCTNYTALIGLNGSGKSNVLEAISIIFASLYKTKNVKEWNDGKEFQYKLYYSIKGYNVEIIDGNILYNTVGEAPTFKAKRDDFRSYLPDEILVCYSGDESRLWKTIYESFYFSYFHRISMGYRDTKQDLVYINKYVWDNALLCLICYEKTQNFIKTLLGIDDLGKIKIKFNFIKYYDKGLNWYKKNDNGSNNDIVNLIERIKNDQYSSENKGKLVYTQISGIEIGNKSDSLSKTRKLFYLLFASGMYKKHKLFEGISIDFKGLGINALSEGEKKQILIKCIMDILANENSLVLFDEPDSHMHISKKKEIKPLIDKEGYFSILTTHSPTLLNVFEDKNSFILSDKGEGVEVTQSSKFSHLKELTNGEFSLMDGVIAISSNKDIILVEGTYDEKYLSSAISYFKSIDGKYEVLDFVFVNAGGASNVLELFNKINRSIGNHQLFITICDDDTDGRSAIKDVEKKLKKLKKANFSAFVYPKVDVNLFKNDFVLENYFPIEIFKSLYNEKVNNATVINELNSLPNIKNYIQSHYSKFKPEDFKGFKVLIDKLLELKNQQLINNVV